MADNGFGDLWRNGELQHNLKYGFVYLWRDRKHDRYYIGCRWGRETDGYICSSRWMRQSYKRRPEDFKRRILARVYSSRIDLLKEEFRWLQMISDNEIGKKYYNLSKKNFGHWSTDPNKMKTIGQKISEAHSKHPDWGHWSRGKVLSEESKQKIREANYRQFQDQDQREMRRQKALEQWADPEYRKMQSLKKLGKTKGPRSEETKRKISEKKKGKYFNPPMTEETRAKTSQSVSNLIWINDGVKNTRINRFKEIPVGYKKGRLKNV